MPKPQIFVSCGQRTQEEKQLGEEICQTIRNHGAFDCFFAEAQHNLNGLHENILDALANSAGFVTVMHRRGDVSFGDDTTTALVRASVWIEQEIAIAAYIQRTGKRDLLTAAYIEKGVGREGIRELVHLNPFEFTKNEQIIANLKAKLSSWNHSASEDSQGKLELDCQPRYENGISIVHLTPILTNKGSRVTDYSCTLEIPDALLSFNTAYNVVEVQRVKAGYRRFQATERTKQQAPLLRDNPVKMFIQQVSIAHLSDEQKQQVLKQDLYLSAEMGDSVYSLTKGCGDIFGR